MDILVISLIFFFFDNLATSRIFLNIDIWIEQEENG